ncbi:general stress protein [Neobacillus sp. DY30]|uniref:general stress protein n=1 Tax=Neobacillus sp. DY30 TaxID=3047871 RepID=UPI0024BF3A29|nr:general stress protein [Neobacillus sp. DY30]WHY00539.1 general stress protein [Neobacillus sp. DY30]
MDKVEKNVVGVYETEQEAIIAIEKLVKEGYDKQDICVIGKDIKNVNYIADETGTVAEETAATGALAGGTLGGLTGLLVGVGALAIPGVGPIIAAGPIASSLIGAVAGAGLGGLTGALIAIGIPDDEAEYYGNSVKEGKILVLTKNRLNHPLEDQNTLAQANNSSMAQDWDELKRLGNEMNNGETKEDLEEREKVRDPLQ